MICVAQKKMSRYIDVDAVQLKGIPVFDQNLEILIPLSDVRKSLQMTPTADVQKVRHGKWKQAYNNYPQYVCSIGGEYTVVADRVHALKISGEDIYVDTNWYESGEIEYNVFLTQEEAEKALEEMREK